MPYKNNAVKWLNAHGHKLHADGLIDRQIAERAGCVPSVVHYWRKKHGLAANAKSGSEDWRACRGKIIAKQSQTLAMIEAGLTDAEAGAVLGIGRKAFECRRRRHMELKAGGYVGM